MVHTCGSSAGDEGAQRHETYAVTAHPLSLHAGFTTMSNEVEPKAVLTFLNQ